MGRGKVSSCEYIEFYSEKNVKSSRKQHQCCECFRPIPKGYGYVDCKGKFDGKMFSEKQHLYCYHFARLVNGHADMIKLFPASGNYHESLIYDRPHEWYRDDCIPFGGIREHLQESGDDEMQSLYDGLISGNEEAFCEGTGI